MQLWRDVRAARVVEEVAREGRAVCVEDAHERSQKRGLQVLQPSPEQEAAWQELARRTYPMIRGHTIPSADFDEALRLVAEYRLRGPAPVTSNIKGLDNAVGDSPGIAVLDSKAAVRLYVPLSALPGVKGADPHGAGVRVLR